MKDVLRKKIRIVVEQYINSSIDYSKSLLKDISYLNDFSFQNNHIDSMNEYWVFYFYTHNDEYKIMCVITKSRALDTWSLNSEVFWKEFDKKKTPGSGMEYVVDINNIKGYDNFINTVNRKLKNNPINSPEIYHDDYSFMMTKEIVKELIKLIIAYPKIESLNNSDYYDDLKKLYNDTINLSVVETINYIQSNYPGEPDKQMLIYKLNSLDSLDNFVEIQKMSISPENETFS